MRHTNSWWAGGKKTCYQSELQFLHSIEIIFIHLHLQLRYNGNIIIQVALTQRMQPTGDKILNLYKHQVWPLLLRNNERAGSKKLGMRGYKFLKGYVIMISINIGLYNSYYVCESFLWDSIKFIIILSRISAFYWQSLELGSWNIYFHCKKRFLYM